MGEHRRSECPVHCQRNMAAGLELVVASLACSSSLDDDLNTILNQHRGTEASQRVRTYLERGRSKAKHTEGLAGLRLLMPERDG